MPHRSPLKLHITTNHDDDGIPHVKVAGEVDMAVADQVGAAVREHRQGAAQLVLDLSNVTFMDSTGIGLLVRLREQGLAEGWLLSTVASAAVWRVVELCGLQDMLDVRLAEMPSPAARPA
jgi:anti-sigma B factor antagonist